MLICCLLSAGKVAVGSIATSSPPHPPLHGIRVDVQSPHDFLYAIWQADEYLQSLWYTSRLGSTQAPGHTTNLAVWHAPDRAFASVVLGRRTH